MALNRLFSLACLAALAGCNLDFDSDHDHDLHDDPGGVIHGDGVAGLHHVPVSDFTRIENRGRIRLHVEVDPALDEVRAVAGCDDNLIPFIESVVRDDTLVVRTLDNRVLAPRLVCELDIRTPRLLSLKNTNIGPLEAFGDISELESITASGVGLTLVSDVESDSLEIAVSDQAAVQLSGGADELHIRAEDQAVVHARDFAADHVFVDSSSDGDMSLRALERLEGEVDGDALIDVYGDPAERELTLRGDARMDFH